MPQIGMSQIACYDPPPFTPGEQGPIEGELEIRHGKKEQQADERERDNPEQSRFF